MYSSCSKNLAGFKLWFLMTISVLAVFNVRCSNEKRMDEKSKENSIQHSVTPSEARRIIDSVAKAN